MGVDATYQAIPYQPLLARAMVDRDLAEAVQTFPHLATADPDNPWYRDDPAFVRLVPDARQVLRDRPGIVDRTFSTRAWDAMYWLLSPNRREDRDRDPAGLAEIAVFGAEPFGCGGTSTQGFPLQFVRPETAMAVAAYVERAVESARDVFDTEAMIADGVYKAPWALDHLTGLLARCARLYRLAAELDECVLVVRD